MAFKDIFIKPEEPEVKKEKNSNNSTSSTNNTVQNNLIGNTPSVSSFTQPIQHTTIQSTIKTASDLYNESDENIIKTLWETILAANTPAPDYCEIKQNAAALANLGLSIEKQYEGAFNVLKAQYPNFTKQDILNSIDTYIKIIENEKVEGKKQCEEKQKKLVGDKQTRVTQLNETADSILKQIDDLKKQHEDILKSIQTLQEEITLSTKELDIQAQKFENSVNVVLNSLTTDRDKIASLNI